jgi:hypothetical protein
MRESSPASVWLPSQAYISRQPNSGAGRRRGASAHCRAIFGALYDVGDREAEIAVAQYAGADCVEQPLRWVALRSGLNVQRALPG